MAVQPNKFALTSTERKLFTMDYSPWLASGEVLTNITFVPQQVTTPPFVINGVAISLDGKSVSFYAQGGVSPTMYEVEVTATTSLTEIKNDQIFFAVRDL